MQIKSSPRHVGEKAREKKRKAYAGFLDLEKAYDRVDTEALWHKPRIYDVGGKMLNGINSMYVNNSLACVRVK